MRNGFLAALPDTCRDALLPHLRPMPLPAGAVLAAARPLSHVYFPHHGVVAVMRDFSDGTTVEVATIGHPDVLAPSAAPVGGFHPTSAVVRCAGVASMIDAKAFRTLCADLRPLREALFAHQQEQIDSARRTAACNAAHAIQARLCRRLLMIHDLVDGDDLPLTQATIAQMLGVQRNSVSLITVGLQRAGLIRYRRGRMRLVDPEGLARLSCECRTDDIACSLDPRPGAGAGAPFHAEPPRAILGATEEP